MSQRFDPAATGNPGPGRATGFEAGLVEIDGVIHAIRRRILGRYAICGAGRVTHALAGRFDSRDSRSCRDCAAVLADGPSGA